MKEIRAEAERSRLQDLFGQRQKLEKLLAAVDEDRREATGFVQEADQPAAADLRALSSFMVGINSRARMIAEAAMKIERQISDQKIRLCKAEQDERCLNKLRARRYAEWKRQAEREIDATAQELWRCSHTTSREDAEHS